MADGNVKLLITSQEQATATLNKIRQSLLQVEGAAGQMGRSFSQLKGLMTGALAGVSFKALADQVIEYNSKLENSRLGIGAIITSMTEITDAQGNVLQGQEKFNAASRLAVEAQQKLQTIGMSTAATYTELVEVFQGILAPALGAKATFEETIELTGLLTNSVKALGLDFSQVKQEARDLIQGGITPASSSLATALGISNEMVKTWRQQGTLVDELKKRLEGFSYAAKEVENTWEGAWSNFKDVMQKALGEGGKAAFDSLKGQIRDITSMLVDVKRDAGGAVSEIRVKPEVIHSFRQLAGVVTELIGFLRQAAQLARSLPGAGLFRKGWSNWYNTSAGMKEIREAAKNQNLPQISDADLDRLWSKGISPSEVGAAIAAGKIQVEADKRKDPRQVYMQHAATWDEKELDAWLAKRNAPAGVRVTGLKNYEDQTGKPSRTSARTAAGKDAADHARVEEETQRSIQESAEAALESTVKRLEHEKSIIELEADLARQKDSSAVDKGEMPEAQAVKNQYDLKRKILEAEAEILNTKMLALSEADPRTEEYGYKYLELRQQITLSYDEEGLAIEEVARKQKAAADSAKTRLSYVEQSIEGMFGGLRPVMEDFFFDPMKADFAGLVDFMRRAWASLCADMVTEAMKASMKAGLGNIFGSFFGGIFGGFGGGVLDMTSGWGSGGIPLAVDFGPMFARGGIATRPSIFGDAGPEAAVPLPDGRSIPVTLNKAAAAPPVTVNITNNSQAQVKAEGQPRFDGKSWVVGVIVEDFHNRGPIYRTLTK